MDKLKGMTPKGEAMHNPKYAANPKEIGSETIVQNLVSESAAFQPSEPTQCDPYKGMVSPLKVKK